jgi:hypothetical protein
MSQRSIAVSVCAVAIATAGLVGTVDAAQRTFVSTTGSDSNACSITLPCRGFAKAITVTDAGGELVVLDSGGYGAVTVDKNVTILSPAGVYAGISVFAAQDGVTVTAPATKVVLRGLTINGQGGNNGIKVLAGEVHAENVVISNMAQAGIAVSGGSAVRISGTVSRSNADGLRVAPGAGSVSVLVRDSEFSGNATSGIGVSPVGAGLAALVTIERASVTKNGVGISVGPGGGGSATVVVTQSVTSENTGAGVSSGGSGGTVYVRESAVTRNGVGLFQGGSSVLNACGSNLLVANGAATSGTVTVNAGACLDQVAGGTVTNLAQGSGITLTPNPVTTTGTIAADTAYLQRRVSGTCAAGSSIRTINADGTVACETDDVGVGTVTSVGTGTGLTGGPITTTGTIAADTAYLQRRVSGVCAAGSSIRTINTDGTVVCETDDVGTGTVTSITAGAGLTGGTITTSGTIAVDPTSATLVGSFFRQGGNAFGATAVVGTTDAQAIEVMAGGARVARFAPSYVASAPNVIFGSSANAVSPGLYGSTIGGGGEPSYPNRVTTGGGTVGGGFNNRAGPSAPTFVNWYSTVAGGWGNTADIAATVGGGYSNNAGGEASFVGGGGSNTAGGPTATIAGGTYNLAWGDGAFVGGGYFNSAQGDKATVPGGGYNHADGAASFAAGSYARANHDNAFVWSSYGSPAPSFAASRFHVLAQNGFSVDYSTQRPDGGGTRWIYIGPDDAGIPLSPGNAIVAWNGAVLSNGGVWTNASDRALKDGFAAVDSREVLAKVAALPIARWHYKAEGPTVTHVGPVAQDFRAAFGVGAKDTTIATVDADGVALAAIQGLYAELRDRDARISELRDELAALRAALATLARHAPPHGGAH